MKISHIAALGTLLCTALLCSCANKTLLDETRTFQNDTWMRFQPEKFQVEAPNTEDCYNFVLSVTVDTMRYRQPSVPVTIEIESPSTEKRTLFSTLVLRNQDGKWLAHANPDGTMSATQTVRQFYFFNTTGTHTVTIGQRTNKYEIHGIKSLHLNVTKAKLEYPE